jgi:hypothetical protein
MGATETRRRLRGAIVRPPNGQRNPRFPPHHFRYIDRALLIGPYMALCMNERSFVREMKKLEVNDPPPFMGKNGHATTHYFDNEKRGLICVVCIKHDKKKTIEQIHALLAHEAVHVWQAFKDFINEKNPSGEMEAYAVQNIFQSLAVAYREAVKR